MNHTIQMNINCSPPNKDFDTKGVLPYVWASILLHLIIIAYASTQILTSNPLIATSEKDSITIFENIFIEKPSAPSLPPLASTLTPTKKPTVISKPKVTPPLKTEVAEAELKLPVQKKLAPITAKVPSELKKVKLTTTRVYPNPPAPTAPTSAGSASTLTKVNESPTLPAPLTSRTETPSVGGEQQAEQRNTSSYINALTSIIRGNIFYPLPAERTGTEGRVLLGLHVHEDGTITGIRVAKSSGYGILDRAAVKIAGNSSPLPPPPYGALAVEVSLVFSLKNQ